MSDYSNRIQLALISRLDEVLPIDSRNELEDRRNRLEHVARLAVRECRRAELDQVTAISILARLWREP